MARAIDPIIDEADPIEVSYKMEVSSPGIERELVRDFHFLTFLDSKVIVKFRTAVDGVKVTDVTHFRYLLYNSRFFLFH